MNKENMEFAKFLLTPFVYLLAIGLAVLLIGLFRKRLRFLLKYLGINTLKFAGVEISMSSAELERAQKKAVKSKLIEKVDKEESSELTLLAELVSPYIVGRRVLWVDDNPLYNTEERRAFRLLGIEVVNRLYTPEAIEALCRDDYDLVISDMNREPNSSPPEQESPCDQSVEMIKARKAGDNGWETLAVIRKIPGKMPIPVIFYHGNSSLNEKLDSEARKKDAVGATTAPATLYRWVLCTLLMKVVLSDDNLRHLITIIPRETRQRLTFLA